MKKLTKIFLTGALTLGLAPLALTAFLSQNEKTIEIKAINVSGNGTFDSPYLVSEYSDLRELFTNFDGFDAGEATRHIVLISNIMEDVDRNNYSLSVAQVVNSEGKIVYPHIYLDLNGYRITRSCETTDATFLNVGSQGNLYIQDKVGTGGFWSSLTNSTTFNRLFYVSNGGVLTINGGVYRNDITDAAINSRGLDNSGGTVTIYNGTFYAGTRPFISQGTDFIYGGSFNKITEVAGSLFEIQGTKTFADVILDNPTVTSLGSPYALDMTKKYVNDVKNLEFTATKPHFIEALSKSSGSISLSTERIVTILDAAESVEWYIDCDESFVTDNPTLFEGQGTDSFKFLSTLSYAQYGHKFDNAKLHAKLTTGDEVIDQNLLTIVPETKYMVSFDANGGTGSMETVMVEDGSEYSLPECTFTAPAGQEFDCWTIDGSSHAVGDQVTVTANVTVTAAWKDIPAPAPKPSKKGCGGSVIATSVVLSSLALVGVGLIIFKKKKVSE